MIELQQWAIKHHVSAEALADLQGLFLRDAPHLILDDIALSEQAISHHLRVMASDMGGRLWRNNVGAGKLENGGFLRWGLCNDTTAINRIVKSADLIGIFPLTVTPNMIGQTIGQFWSVEVKRQNGRANDAQYRWAKQIAALGGKAIISKGEL